LIGAKKEETSDGLLSSEDLKEEKVVTTSVDSVSCHSSKPTLPHFALSPFQI